MLACTFLHFVAYVARLRGKASFSLSPCTLGISVLKALFGSPRPFRCLLEIKNGRGWSEWAKPLMYISNAPHAHVCFNDLFSATNRINPIFTNLLRVLQIFINIIMFMTGVLYKFTYEFIYELALHFFNYFIDYNLSTIRSRYVIINKLPN